MVGRWKTDFSKKLENLTYAYTTFFPHSDIHCSRFLHMRFNRRPSHVGKWSHFSSILNSMCKHVPCLIWNVHLHSWTTTNMGWTKQKEERVWFQLHLIIILTYRKKFLSLLKPSMHVCVLSISCFLKWINVTSQFSVPLWDTSVCTLD